MSHLALQHSSAISDPNSSNFPHPAGPLTRILVAGAILSALVTEHCPAQELEQLCAIEGHIVSEDGSNYGWLVFDRTDGLIVEICDASSDLPADTEVVRHDGYIFPGLIDTHNHAHFASLPLWRSDQLYTSRYEWQADPDYLTEVDDRFDSLTSAGLFDESLTYGEIRALAGGTTMIQGTEVGGSRYLVRNLDQDPWKAVSFVGPITSAPPQLVLQARLGLQFGLINRLFLHVGEGRADDAVSAAELPYLASIGLTVPGVVVIHGTALNRADFDIMAANGMFLAWSPTSNDVLYGETTDILAALEAGVTVALAPDWTISGSDNLLEEMKVAYRYSQEQLGGALSPRQIYRMATVDAARVAGVAGPGGERLGKLAVGYEADLFLAPCFDADPHVSLLKTYARDLNLVVVDGQPLLGNQRYMGNLSDLAHLDEVRISNRKKFLDLSDPAGGPQGLQSFDGLVDSLTEILGEIAPLVEDAPGDHPGFPRALPGTP